MEDTQIEKTTSVSTIQSENFFKEFVFGIFKFLLIFYIGLKKNPFLPGKKKHLVLVVIIVENLTTNDQGFTKSLVK